MPLNPPQAYRKTAFTHRIGVDADKPAATDVLPGTLYFSTDTQTLERSDGAVWESFTPTGMSAGPFTNITSITVVNGIVTNITGT